MLSGGNEGSKDEEKWSDKVYTRKALKGPKNSKIGSKASVKRLGNPGLDAGSDNFSGLNPDGSGEKGGFLSQENRIRLNFSNLSKHELHEVRRNLEAERDMIRSLMRKIEVNEVEKDSRRIDNSGGDKAAVEVVPPPPRVSKPLKQLSVSVVENSKGKSGSVEKEKRTPKANKMYRNSEFLLAKDKFPPPESHKKLKSSVKKDPERGPGSREFPKQVSRSCHALLERLMKHKHGWVFNKPVDTVTLGLHDYFEIIKNPMDLGTVKTRLNQNWYNSSAELAEDIRLTFRNALTYNSKEQDVYSMAQQLSKIFEDKWVSIEADIIRESRDFDAGGVPTPGARKVLDRSESMVDMKPKPKAKSKIVTPKKPKAKDPNKREMSYDEKQKLSVDLQSLPSEKLENVVHIIKKRNPSVSQQDDEIEVDIDSVDTETLWELDRFITNYKKGLSKNKRKAEISGQLVAGPEKNTREEIPASTVEEMPKESGKDEEKVVSPPTQVKKQEGGLDTNQENGSSTSSGSSSSDSDGESSSGSGSDNGHSPKN